MRLVLVQGLRPVAIGIAAGLAGAFLLSRFIATLLFGITPRDPLTYVLVAALLLATAVIACIVPARQALRIDVVSALRSE
jgi:ABC-type antimicrobial peptide transport system permease subunit